VFDGTTDTVYTSGNVVIPEGFEKVVIGGATGANVTANGLSNFITGSAGNDKVDGAGGTDTFTTQGTFAQSTGVLNKDGSVSLTAAGGGTDTLTRVEQVQFSDMSKTTKEVLDTAQVTYSINPLRGVPLKLPDIAVGDGIVSFASQTNDWYGNEEKGLTLSSGKWLTAHNVKVGDTYNNTYNIEIARFNADGTPDTTFGTAGVTRIAGFADALSLAESTNGEVFLSQSAAYNFGFNTGLSDWSRPKIWKISSSGVASDSGMDDVTVRIQSSWSQAA
jgi:hypothetical protein